MPRARHEIPDRARDEHLAGARQRAHARADVDGEAAEVVVEPLALARVEARAHLEAEVGDAVPDRAGRVDRPPRPVEGGEEAVAERLDLLPAEAREALAHEPVVGLE